MQMTDVRFRYDPAMALKVEKNLQMSLNFKRSQKLLASITTREPFGMEFKWTSYIPEHVNVGAGIITRMNGVLPGLWMVRKDGVSDFSVLRGIGYAVMA